MALAQVRSATALPPLPWSWRAVYALLYAAVLSGSFFTTLWLTEPDGGRTSSAVTDNRPIVERFSGRKISSQTELARTARDVGLRLSQRLRGNVDALSRINEREVTVAGWLADPQGDATPLNLLIFASGAMAGATQTNGERPDVTQAMHLDQGAEKNVGFSRSFNCKTGDQPIIVGVSAALRQYITLDSGKCP